MKKTFFLLFLGVALASCDAYSASPAVKSFLTGMSGPAAYEAIDAVSVAETYRSLDGQDHELGKLTSVYEMSKEDASNLYWHRLNTYSGDQIANGITEAEYLLKKVNGTYHTYINTTATEVTKQDLAVTDDKASSLVTEIIYTDQESYDSGGLYYGDIFKINASQFPNEAFALSSDGSQLTFDYKYETTLNKDSGGTDLLLSTQDIIINAKGLIVSSYELLRINSSGEAGENILTPTYDPTITRLDSI
jgi:hypothetical protein